MAAKVMMADMAVNSLGMGFDLASDFRLKFAKGLSRNRRLVEIDEFNVRDLVVPGGLTLSGVSKDISCDKGDRLRFKSDMLEFNQMSELLNQRSSIQGKVPSGYFNSLFELTSMWYKDAADTKYVSLDGYFISLYNLQLNVSPLILHKEVKKAVPSDWSPILLSRFIQTYGTHVIVGMSVGGQDVICLRQRPSSSVPPYDLKGYLEDLGDYLFSDGRNLVSVQPKMRESKNKVPVVFKSILNANHMLLPVYSEDKDGIKIICSKRGGNLSAKDHQVWLQTVPENPDAILFKFVPITSLLTGVPGSGYLSHAINLYLRYKPATEDLHYFLAFQVPRQWAPMFNELPLGRQRKTASAPALRFSFMGPKLRVNVLPVSTNRIPLVGLRLYLEGRKGNQLGIHVQHLSSVPSIIEGLYATSSNPWPCRWRGSDELPCSNLEPTQWRRYSQVCTTVVDYNPDWLHEGSIEGVFVVTGAQLLTERKLGKVVLHLRLLFTHVPTCSIHKSDWARAHSSPKSSFFTNLSTTFLQRGVTAVSPKQTPALMNSGVYPVGPPIPVCSQKLLKYVDTSEVVRGAHDMPGHWLVTAAQLVIEGQKIALNVKFSLLSYVSGEKKDQETSV